MLVLQRSNGNQTNGIAGHPIGDLPPEALDDQARLRSKVPATPNPETSGQLDGHRRVVADSDSSLSTDLSRFKSRPDGRVAQ